MNATNEEIVWSYEGLGMTPEQIAEDQSLDIKIVKATLLDASAAYRKTMSQSDVDELFSDEDLRSASQTMKECLYDDDASLRFRAARFIIDEKKGRNDARVSLIGQGNCLNALELNQRYMAAFQALERGRQQKMLEKPTEERMSRSKIIDVEPVAA